MPSAKSSQSATQRNRTPLYDWHAAHGARMVDFAGWSMPVQYTSIVAEHQATRSAVGLFDISHMGRLAISGKAATEFLDSVLTRRATDMKPGQIRYSLVCDEAGGILDDILVYRLTENQDGSPRYLLVVNASNREKIVHWLEDKNPTAAQIEDQTVAKAMVAVQGPRAVEMVDHLFGCELRSLRYYTGTLAKIAGNACYLSRTGYTGEDGCEIICASHAVVAIWEQLAAAAAPLGGLAAGLAARDTLRLEAGMPLYGHELSETINPVQAGLGFAMNLDSRTFVGRDAIAHILVHRKEHEDQPVRIGLQLAGRRVARQGCQLFRGEEKIGAVTSGTFSPTLERPIAMAYVKESAAAADTALAVDIRGHQHTVTVVPLPFYHRGQSTSAGVLLT